MRLQRRLYSDNFSDLLLCFNRSEHMKQLHKDGRYKGTSKIGIWNSSEEKRERISNRAFRRQRDTGLIRIQMPPADERKMRQEQAEENKNTREKSLSECSQGFFLFKTQVIYNEGRGLLFIVEPPQIQRCKIKYINGYD